MTPLAEVTFNWDLGQFLSLPVMLGIVGGLVWLKNQIAKIVNGNYEKVEANRVIEAKVLKEELETRFITNQAKLTEIKDATVTLSDLQHKLNGSVEQHLQDDAKHFAEIAVDVAHIKGRLDERATRENP